jgi:hypothetical protein
VLPEDQQASGGEHAQADDQGVEPGRHHAADGDDRAGRQVARAVDGEHAAEPLRLLTRQRLDAAADRVDPGELQLGADAPSHRRGHQLDQLGRELVLVMARPAGA